VRGEGAEDVTNFFAKFAPHMGVPIDEDGAWRKTNLFKESGMAPQANQGDIKELVDTILEWSEETPDWLE
jgi:hypothetical protein